MGIYDAHGNVNRLTNDRYGEYPKEAVIDPTTDFDINSLIAMRSGTGNYPHYHRSARRLVSHPNDVSPGTGFRAVRTIH